MNAKTCTFCGHSKAAHIDKKCALCSCTSEVREFVQETFAFRTVVVKARSVTGKRDKGV